MIYGCPIEDHERPNWINFVRSPIERLASQFYFCAYPPPPDNKNGIMALQKLEKELACKQTSAKCKRTRIKRSLAVCGIIKTVLRYD